MKDERETLKAKIIISDLLRLIYANRLDCDNLHHNKNERHDWSEECPVIKKYEKVIQKAEDYLK